MCAKHTFCLVGQALLEVAQNVALNAKRCSKVIEQNCVRPTRVVDDWTLCASV